MKVYDVGFGWAHPADQEFAILFRSALKKRHHSVLEVTFENLEQVIRDVKEEKIGIRTFFNRGVDDDPGFPVLGMLLSKQGSRIVNNLEQTVLHNSKAVLHELFETNGLPVPKTVILRSRVSKKQAGQIAEQVGVPFVIKPGHGGGGDYVKTNATTAKEIEESVADNAPDQTLVQEYITPALLKGRIAWFRPIYAAGNIISLWWDPRNHFYEEFGNSKEENQAKNVLEQYVEKMANISGMDLFSSEIVLDQQGNYVVVDYLNHPIDLNPRDVVPDGLPRPIVERIATYLAAIG